MEGATWDFFNHQRLFDLARMANLKLRDFTSFEELRQYGMLTHDGLIASPKTWKVGRPSFRLYDVYEAMHLYFYTKQILEAVIKTLPIIDLSNRWSKSEIEALVKPGAWVGLQAAFYFKKLNRVSKGRNQRRRGLRRRDGIEVTFEFDAWESTSSTSQNCHLSGYQTAVVIILVRSIQKNPQLLRISASCLAIGSGFAEGRSITTLRPPPSIVYYQPDSEEDDEYMV